MKRITRSRKWPSTLSLCMIVKNEAETLEKCLRYARPFVDEIVIVDTGSTDGTQEIARRYADVYDEIEWPGSFSEARNHSLELATGDFFMVLDGDEYLPDARQWRRMRRHLVDELACLYLPVKNLLNDESIVAADRFWQERVMRNAPEVRYAGRVHNQIVEGLKRYVERTGKKQVRFEAEIVHVGYSWDPERLQTKYRPRVELLQAEYEEADTPVKRAYYGFQLGVSYTILRELERAAELWREIRFDDLVNPDNRLYAHLLAAKGAFELERPSDGMPHCEAMFAMTQDEPVVYLMTGMLLTQMGRGADALLMLHGAFDVNQAQRTARFQLSRKLLLTHLANACEKIGLTDQSAVMRAMIEKETYDSELLRHVLTQAKYAIAKSAA